MNNILISLNGTSKYQVEKEYDFVIAVDGGYKFLKDRKIKIDLLVGDLDSLDEKNIECEILKFDPEKDDTDFYLALKYVEENFSNYKIDVVNYKSAKRIEHLFANLRLMNSTITYIDEYTEIRCFTKGSYEIKNTHKFISLFAVDDVENINLTNTKYELKNYNSNRFDNLMISNEIIKDSCNLTFEKGTLIVFLSNED